MISDFAFSAVVEFDRRRRVFLQRGRRADRTPSGHDRRKMGQDQSGADVLHRHDPNSPAGELGEEIPILLEAGFEHGHFENDWLRGEEIGRTGEPGVERLKPFRQRLGRFEGERQQRAGPKIHGLSAGRMRIHKNRSVAGSLTIYASNSLRKVKDQPPAGSGSRAPSVGPRRPPSTSLRGMPNGACHAGGG